MSTRAMVFIDGTWLGVVANRLADQHGIVGRTGGPLDFGQLPVVCAESVAQQMAPGTALDIVRTHWFGSIAANFDPADADVVQRRAEFFDALRRQYRYEVVRFETDYRGGRVRRTERGTEEEPREKAVDVGLATALLEMAALDAYDIAIVIAGDRDFVPALQAVRRLGKRVALVTARGSCPREFADVNDAARVRDFDLLLLDALWPRIVSRTVRPLQLVVTPPSDVVVPMSAVADESAAPTHTPCEGTIARITADGRIYVRGDDNGWYFFRPPQLRDPAWLPALVPHRTRVRFTVQQAPEGSRAGRLDDVEPLEHTISLPMREPVGPRATLDPLWDVDPFAPPPRIAPVAEAAEQ